MGQQLNKIIKRKRRAAYLKRKKAAASSCQRRSRSQWASLCGPQHPGMIKVSLISLGCAKNLVDSEIMVGHLHKAGMKVIPEAEKADVVIVNTCSFIDSSKEESIGHILEVHENRGMRKRRREQKLIVAGCMSQRFSKDLPGLDARGRRLHRPGPDHQGRADHRGALRQGARLQGRLPASFVTPEVNLHPGLRHAEVQADPRPFCVREDRGGLQPPVHVLHHPADPRQAPEPDRRKRGRPRSASWSPRACKEVNLISQDTTFFGMDTWEERPNPRTPVDSTRGTALTLAPEGAERHRGRLLDPDPLHAPRSLERRADHDDRRVPEGRPVRRHAAAAHQRPHADDAAGDERRLHPRPGAPDPGGHPRDRPPHHLHRRLPRETEADVDELCEFIRETKFERLGVFRYSQEEGTRAGKMEGQVPAKEKERRWHRLMALQKVISGTDVSAAASARR
jgi:ribosomal protein S12 methylthiotransferase